ncbi:flagellin [Kurthia huakuii]|uniref:flagellin N-terminal helical domain-containing protein n=1 Tax=Kurthia huakuii TaxID=1421019 RepID=UPI00049849F6|nr:flagellin [Kurthia huakuii]MBM7698849.1 flagellin [Kurthia huakuii]
MRIGAWHSQGMNIWGNMNRQWNAASKALERLSTGYRINRAGDDPAGLAISEKMRAQINGLNMASKNIQDGISMVQTAEGALNETHSMLQRMRELSVQSANDTLTDDDRALIEVEFQELKKEVTRISTDTEFNTRKLLNGDNATTPLKIQVGANAGQTIDLTMNDMSADAIGLTDASIATRDEAESALSTLDEAIKKVSMERAQMGAYQNRMEHAYNVNVNTAENLTAAESRIRDADIAKEMMNFTKASILQQAAQYAMAMHMQTAQGMLQLLKMN